MLIYIEYISRRSGVSLEDFYEGARRGQTGWAGEYPQDVIVANLGRTWRLGPDPEYVCIWWTRDQGLGRIDDWERAFRTGEAAAFETSFSRVARIDRAGCYEPLLDPVPGIGERYYMEWLDFAEGATRDDIRAAYEERQARSPTLTLNLLADRIGQLAPEPRALALWSIPDWRALESVAREYDDVRGPAQLVTAAAYSQLGMETL